MTEQEIRAIAQEEVSKVIEPAVDFDTSSIDIAKPSGMSDEEYEASMKRIHVPAVDYRAVTTVNADGTEEINGTPTYGNFDVQRMFQVYGIEKIDNEYATQKADFDSHVTDKTDTFDSHVATKTSELDSHVETVNKPALDSYVENTEKPAIDSYVSSTSKPALDAYTESKKTELDEYKDSKVTEFNSSATEKATASIKSITDEGTKQIGLIDAIKEQIDTTASTVATNATSAQDSATSASASATRANEYMASAKTYSETATEKAGVATTKATEASSSATSASASAKTAERFAKGTENGTAVTSGDGFEDNAKYYKELAKGYAESIDVSQFATKATTLAGYGITDAYTKTEADGKYQLLSKLLSVAFVLADGKADIQIGDEIAGHGGVIYADLAVANMGLDMTWTVPSVTWNEYKRDVHGVHLIKDNGNPRYLAMDYTDLGTANNYGTGTQALTWGPNDQNWTDMIDGVGAFTESGAKYTPTAVTYNGIALEADWCPTIGRRNMWVPMCMMKGTDNSWIASDLENINWGKSSYFWKAAWVKAGAIPYDYSRADRTKHPFYVPTKTEIQALNRAHWLRKVTSSFWSWYWSSTNYSDTQAWLAGFNWGNQYAFNKVFDGYEVRLVRTF